MLGVASMRSGLEKDQPVKRKQHEIISMYTTPPSEELTLDEFELFALDRLTVLRKLEDLKARGYKGREFTEHLEKAVNTHMKINSLSENVEEAIRKDTVSHFILRLAYCRTEDLRRWFLTQESALFRYRLESLSSTGIISFIQSNGLAFEVVSADDKAARRSRLLTAPGATAAEFERCTFYRIPFAQATDLIGQRLVYLEGGYAYVPVQRVVAIVVARFRAALSRSLAEASGAFPAVTGDPRFGPLLQNMSRQYVGRDFGGGGGGSGDAIRPEHLDAMAARSMPLCMRGLHLALRRDHKLKHMGRLQYGLFLKGAGLSMEDAAAFWQSEFTRVMSIDAFTKGYAYNVRHMYGKEGKRTNYTPYSCLKIIMGAAPGAGEHHGCPYRHFDESHLSALFGQLKLERADRDAMAAHVKGRNYQLACQRHFEATHRGYEDAGVSADGVGNHPNAWTAASMQYWKAKEGGATAAAAATAATAAAAAQQQQQQQQEQEQQNEGGDGGAPVAAQS